VAAVRAWEGNTDLRKLLVPVGELRRHPSNPRRGDMDAIRASLRRFGQQRPVLALPDGTIVAGNHTFQGTVDEGWSDRDAVVLDPFAGSGTTLIACENLGRRAALVELDPRYCDVIRQRYADYVGDQSFAP
jgi:adenine-specific DNA methylase